MHLKHGMIMKKKSYIQKSYARKATPKDPLELNENIYYIPHFSVVNYNKPHPKPRLVCDAATMNEGISLNSRLGIRRYITCLKQ